MSVSQFYTGGTGGPGPAPSSPMDAILQAYKQKIMNQNQMNQNISGIGQGLGSAMGNIGQAIQQQQQKQALQQLMNYYGNQMQGNSAFGGTMGGMQNPMYQSVGQNTGLASGPLSMLGGQGMGMGGGQTANSGWTYVGPANQMAMNPNQ